MKKKIIMLLSFALLCASFPINAVRANENAVPFSVDAWSGYNHEPFPKNPTSNSFSYLTGWDKEYFEPPSYISGVKANSSAWVYVPGMESGEHEVFVYCEVEFSDL